MAKLNEQLLVLIHLDDYTRPDGEYCQSFAPIAHGTELSTRRVRFLCRLLARKGLAEFHLGLWNEDGGAAGAGYCISKAGHDFVADKEVAA